MLPLSIAWRFLTSNKVQTVMIVMGIAVGISVQVFVGTLIQSLQATLVEQTIGHSSHITVFPLNESAPIAGWESLESSISKVSGVESISPAVDRNALINTPDGRSFPALTRGFDIDRADAIYDLTGRIYKGTPPTEGQVLVGKDNQERYALALGGTLTFVLPDGTQQNLTISGFFDLGIKAVNKGWAITTLGTAQSLFGLGTGVTSIEMQVSDVMSADTLAKDVKKALSSQPVTVTNWKDDNADLLSGLQAQSSSSYMIQVFVVASVVIAIASVLAISVMQKSRQIGILKAMGITNIKASLIFLFQGLILGAAGGTRIGRSTSSSPSMGRLAGCTAVCCIIPTARLTTTGGSCAAMPTGMQRRHAGREREYLRCT